MSRVHVGIEIDADPDTVWQVVEPIERHVDWMADAESIRFTSAQSRGVGTTFVCRTKVGPLRLDDHMAVTEWQPGAVMGVDHRGIVAGSGRFTITALDLGRRTRFEWTEQLHFPWYLGGPVGAAVGSRLVLAPIWRRNLRRLRTLVEAQPGRAGTASPSDAPSATSAADGAADSTG